jgi:hypothetical protein
LILFKAQDLEAAERLTAGDPFVVEQVIEAKWLKRWLPCLKIGQPDGTALTKATPTLHKKAGFCNVGGKKESVEVAVV